MHKKCTFTRCASWLVATTAYAVDESQARPSARAAGTRKPWCSAGRAGRWPPVWQELPSSRAPHRAMLQLLTALAAVAACLAATERQRSALAAVLRALAGLVSACKGACAAVPHLTAFTNTAGCGRATHQGCLRAQSRRGLSARQQQTLGRWLRPSATASSCTGSLRAACRAGYILVSLTRLSCSLSCGPSLTCLAPPAPDAPNDLTPCFLRYAGLCCGLVYAIKVVWLGGPQTDYKREVIKWEGTPSFLCHPSIVRPAGFPARTELSLSADHSLLHCTPVRAPCGLIVSRHYCLDCISTAVVPTANLSIVLAYKRRTHQLNEHGTDTPAVLQLPRCLHACPYHWQRGCLGGSLGPATHQTPGNYTERTQVLVHAVFVDHEYDGAALPHTVYPHFSFGSKTQVQPQCKAGVMICAHDGASMLCALRR